MVFLGRLFYQIIITNHITNQQIVPIMKKIFISAMLLCSSMLGFAQLVEIQSIDKIDLPEGVAVDQATISPDGSFVVFSQYTQGGLHKMDLATKEINMISADGNSFDLKIGIVPIPYVSAIE